MNFKLILSLSVVFVSSMFANQITSWAQYQDLKVKPGYNFFEFGAPWCGYCNKLAPVWQNAANKYKGKAGFYKINVDNIPNATHTKAAGGEEISGLPTVIIFKDGKEIARERGGMSEEDFNKVVAKYLK